MRPLSKRHAHSLVFLANSLAAIYDDQGVETRVIKHSHGPFYPDAQWDLDRMVGQGLLKIDDIEFKDNDGRWWMDANYRPTPLGEQVYLQCRQDPMLGRSYRFLVELTSAFASLATNAQDTAPIFDAIYGAPGKADWTPLVFEQAQDNFTALTASAFDGLMGPAFQLSSKERLQLYFTYLGHMASKNPEASA